MPSITLYGGRSGSSLRPHWMLAELGLEYETKSVDFAKGEHRSPEFLALNPAGQIPVMVYDGFTLPESTAIVHFLAEKHGPALFGPWSPEAHATSLRWQIYTLLNIEKPFTTLAGKKWGQPASAENEAAAVDALARHLPVLESLFAKNAYVTGDAFSIADIVMRCTLNYAELAEVDLAASPSILAWMGRCSDRPAYVKAKQG